MEIRPYRAAPPVDEVVSIMARDAGPKLDARAFAALEAWLPDRDATLADAA
jgi:HD-GYP domain-containing protein (c-di-GMP phosphodiesterase class II)